jgi:transcriptional regulator with XRE-family HTH domain
MKINDKSSWFEEELKKLENNNDALVYKYILDFSENVLIILNKNGIKNKNKFLAKKLNVSPAYISKLFNGKTNFTVKKLVEIANAVDYKLEINLRPKLVAVSQTANSTISINAQGKINNYLKDQTGSVDIPAHKLFAFTATIEESAKVA